MVANSHQAMVPLNLAVTKFESCTRDVLSGPTLSSNGKVACVPPEISI